MGRISAGNKSLTLPAMVPSISSFETQLPIRDAIALQQILQEPISLVSAFDLREKSTDTEELCKKFRDTGILLLDSGGYEWSRIRKYVPTGYTRTDRGVK
jgi:hypothetical protein